MSAELSVVICSLDGAGGVDRCLRRLADQTISASIEVAVVDDGSRDGTSEVARSHGVIVIRHEVNRGIAAARNTGIAATTAPIVAFLDDTCEPDPDWAERLLAGYREDVAGAGGPVLPVSSAGLLSGFLDRHNPLQPLELNLARSNRVLYRFRLYLQRQWRPEVRAGQREVFSLVGANMSFRRDALLAAGGFDERFRFGAEEVDLCMRLRRSSPSTRLVYVPDATIKHRFQPSLRDILRRSRAYGRGSARLYRKWPGVPPTLFPGPVGVLALLLASAWLPPLVAVAAAAPLVLYPQGVQGALTGRGLSCLLDGYVQLGQEASEDIGFVQGLWLFRDFIPQPDERCVPAESLTTTTTTGGYPECSQ